MDMLAPALLHLLQHEGINLAALADASAIAVPVPLAGTIGQETVRCLPRINHVLDLQIRDPPFRDDIGWQMMPVGDIGRFHAGHHGRLNHVGRMRKRAMHDGFLHAIVRKNSPFGNFRSLGLAALIEFSYGSASQSSVLSTSVAAQIRIVSNVTGRSNRSLSIRRVIARVRICGCVSANSFQVDHWSLVSADRVEQGMWSVSSPSNRPISSTMGSIPGVAACRNVCRSAPAACCRSEFAYSPINILRAQCLKHIPRCLHREPASGDDFG